MWLPNEHACFFTFNSASFIITRTYIAKSKWKMFLNPYITKRESKRWAYVIFVLSQSFFVWAVKKKMLNCILLHELSSFFLFGQVHKQSRVWFIWQRVCTIHFFHYRLNNASQFYLYFEICNGFMFVSESCLHSHSSFWQVFCIQFSSIPKLDDDDDRNLIKVKESNWENVSAWKTYTENKMREEKKHESAHDECRIFAISGHLKSTLLNFKGNFKLFLIIK